MFSVREFMIKDSLVVIPLKWDRYSVWTTLENRLMCVASYLILSTFFRNFNAYRENAVLSSVSNDNIMVVQNFTCFGSNIASTKRDTVETRIKELTFLGHSLLKDLMFCLYNPYIMDGGSVRTVETRIKEPTF